MMKEVTRRRFLQGSAVTIGAALTGAPGAVGAAETRRSATDLVPLGKTGIKVTRLGIGTGTRGGSIQRGLGQEGFTHLIRHAYDRGVRFFDTADNYKTHAMLSAALKGLPRESYVIQTKMRWSGDPDPLQVIDRFRTELQSDYLDSLLLHCTRAADWKQTLRRQMDLLEEAKHKRLIRSHGASCHGLGPLEAMPGTAWLDVALVRVNHNGAHMDNLRSEERLPGDHARAIQSIRSIHQSGTGVVGMKIIGEGDFRDAEERDASFKFVANLEAVDAVVIGFAGAAELDEAIDRMNRHLNV